MDFLKITTGFLFTSSFLFANTTTTVSTAGELQQEIINANNRTDSTIYILEDLFLTELTTPVIEVPFLYPLNSNPDFSQRSTSTISILSSNNTSKKIQGNPISFNKQQRGFFVRGGTVYLAGLTLELLNAQGGNGGEGLIPGGGGGGFGGGLYIGSGSTVYVDNVSFEVCKATGGNGGSSTAVDIDKGNPGMNFSGGGGGGFYGHGGTDVEGESVGSIQTAAGGGGGFGGNGGNAGIGTEKNRYEAGGGGGAGTELQPYNTNGGGDFQGHGAGISTPYSPPASGGGGAGSNSDGSTAQDGNYGGGGGGAYITLTSGNGGRFGGGGGQYATDKNNFGTGGLGGFGGGGGGGSDGNSSNFKGGFGGGDGGYFNYVGDNRHFFGGGGGSGYGGAVFIEKEASCTFSNCTFSTSKASNYAISGKGGNGDTVPDPSIVGKDGDSGGIDIFACSSSTLTFNQSLQDCVIPNPIQSDQGADGGSLSAGGLTKTGSERLVLLGSNTYTGTTTVSEGELRIGNMTNPSSILTDTTVAAGATLSGNFSIRANTAAGQTGDLTNSGMVAPGMAKITVPGTFTNNAGGEIRVNITPIGNMEKVFIEAGATSIVSPLTVQITIGPGNYISGTQYKIIDGPTSGNLTFNPILSGAFLGFLEFDLSEGGSVILTVNNDLLFEHLIIDNGPPIEIVKVIRHHPPLPLTEFALLIEKLGQLNSREANFALEDMSPARYSTLEWINERNNSYISYLLSQHLFELCCSARDCCSCDCNASVWVEGFGHFAGNTKRFDYLRRFDANTGGALMGVDKCFWGSIYAGASFGYSYTDLDWKGGGGGGHINSYFGSLYGSYNADWLIVDVAAIGGGNDYDLRRTIAFSDVYKVAKSDSWGQFFTGHLGVRGVWNLCDFELQPFALVDYHYLHRNAFTESGAQSLDLNVRSKTQSMLRGEAGLLGYITYACDCYCIAPYLGISWVGEFALDDSIEKANFVGQIGLIESNVYNCSNQLVSPQAGLNWTWTNGLSIIMGYKGAYNSRTRINSVEGRIEWVF